MDFSYSNEAIYAVRFLTVPLALYNLSWSITGMWGVLKGHFWPISIYRSVIFLVCLSTLGFQASYFAGGYELDRSSWVLIWTLLVLMTQMMAAFGRITGHLKLGERFYWLITSGHLKVALAMADYHAVNPQKAKELADDLQQRTSKRLAARVLKDG